MFKSFALAILAAFAHAQFTGIVSSVTSNADGATNTVDINLDDGTLETITDLPIDIAVAAGDSISVDPNTGDISVISVVVDYPPSDDDSDGGEGAHAQDDDQEAVSSDDGQEAISSDDGQETVSHA